MKPYFEDKAVQIWHGDCREVLPTLQSVDVVVTDPPYSEHVHDKNRRGGPEFPDARTNAASYGCVRDLGFEHITPELMACVSSEFARLVRRWVLVFTDAENIGRWITNLTAANLEHVRVGAWIKEGSTPQFTGDRPASGFEAVEIAHHKGRKRWNGGGKHAVWREPIVLNRSHTDPRLHTAQKPIGLMRELVDLFSDPGEIILDPFMGSGTTLRATKDLGRKAIGIELDEAYCEVAAKRMQQMVLVA